MSEKKKIKIQPVSTFPLFSIILLVVAILVTKGIIPDTGFLTYLNFNPHWFRTILVIIFVPGILGLISTLVAIGITFLIAWLFMR